MSKPTREQVNDFDNRPGTSKRHVSIEDFIHHPYKSTKINSPRSLTAMREFNYSMSELNLIPFENFQREFPATLALSSDLLRKRYDFYEKNRQNKISQIKDLRDSMNSDAYYNSNNPQRDSLSKSLTHNQLTSTHDFDKTTGFKVDKKQYERMKAWREINFINQVQFEIQREIQQQRVTERHQQEVEKNEKQLLSIRRLNEMTKKKNNDKEQDKLRRMEEEEKAKKHLDRVRYESEQRKLIEEREREMEKMRELSKKKEENSLKASVVQGRFHQLNEESSQQLEELRRKSEMKDIERQSNIDEVRISKMKERAIKSRKKREVIEQNNRQLEKELNEIKLLYYEKQAQNEEKKLKYEERTQKLLKEKMRKSKRKDGEIQKALEKNKEEEQRRIEQYLLKQEEILLKADEIEKALKRQQTERRRQNLKRENVAMRKMKENEEESNRRKERLINQMELRDKRLNEKKQYKIFNNINKIEESNQLHIFKQEVIHRIARRDLNDRNRMYEDILNKKYKVNEYLEQKKQIAEEKKRIDSNIQREKEEKSIIFQSLMDKKSFNENAIETIRELFPNHKKINQLVNEIKVKPRTSSRPNRYSLHSKGSMSNINVGNSDILDHFTYKPHQQALSQSNKLMYYSHKNYNPNSNNNNNNDSFNDAKTSCSLLRREKKTQRLSEESIIEEVNRYKTTLNQELLHLLATERENEEKREIALRMIFDPSEREEVEKEYGIERAQASKKISQKGEEYEINVQEYEYKLRNNPC